MAKSGFHINHKGVKEVLNGQEAYNRCNRKGAEISSAINAAGHGSYTFDTIHGKTRIHTRVKTADSKAFFQERNHKTLALWVHRKAVG